MKPGENPLRESTTVLAVVSVVPELKLVEGVLLMVAATVVNTVDAVESTKEDEAGELKINEEVFRAVELLSGITEDLDNISPISVLSVPRRI